MQTLGCTPGQRLGGVTRLPTPFKKTSRNFKRVTVKAVQKEDKLEGTAKAIGHSVLAAIFAVSTAVGFPHAALAKKQEAPPPPPTAYDELQKIVSGRSGNSGSLLQNFQRTAAETTKAVTAPVTNALSSGPKLPEAPQVSKSGSASKTVNQIASQAPPSPAKAVENAAQSTEEVLPAETAGSPIAILGVLAAVGLGGFKLFTNKTGAVAGESKKVGRKAQGGAKRAVGGARQAGKRAPSPVKNAFGTAKVQAKKPAKKASGVLASAKRAVPNPKQVARKVAPTATRKIQKSGTKRIGGTQKVGAGTRRVGGGTRKISTARPSGRINFDDDTQSTIGAAGVVGLGLATAGFLFFNILTGIELPGPADAQQATEEFVQSIPGSSAASKTEGKSNEVAKVAEGETPDLGSAKEGSERVGSASQGSGPLGGVAPLVKKATPDLPSIFGTADKKQSPQPKGESSTNLTQDSDLKGDQNFQQASKALESDTSTSEQYKVAQEGDKKKQYLSQPGASKEPIVGARDSENQGKDVNTAIKTAAGFTNEQSQAPAVGRKSSGTESNTSRSKGVFNSINEVTSVSKVETPDLGSAKEGTERIGSGSQDTAPNPITKASKIIKKATPDGPQILGTEGNKQSPQPKGPETSTNLTEDPALQKSEAFKKLAAQLSQKSSAEQQFKIAQEGDKKKQYVSQPGAPTGPIVGAKRSENQGKGVDTPTQFAKGLGSQASSTPSPPSPQAAIRAATGGENTIVFGGLFAATTVAYLAYQANQGAAKSALKNAADQVQGAGEASSGGSSGSNSGGNSGGKSDGVDDVKEDIKQRKEEAQSWIKNWRDETGGKP